MMVKSRLQQYAFDLKIHPFSGNDSAEDKLPLKSQSVIQRQKVPVFKSTSFGNNFIMVDETMGKILSEDEKSHFAFDATNVNFGIGSDNFIAIQAFNSEQMKEIHSNRMYWNTIPSTKNVDFIFRMFEPDGKEAFSCGNGLLCVAHYLFARYGLKRFEILTQIPTQNPIPVHAGVCENGMSSWVNMGNPIRIGKRMMRSIPIIPLNPVVDQVKGLPIKKLWERYGYRKKSELLPQSLSGYLVFTGEPHLVIFPDRDPDAVSSGLSSYLFKHADKGSIFSSEFERIFHSSSDFLQELGMFIQNEYSSYFPSGINIDFARSMNGGKIIEYRCFERGILKETLSCGTGALASAYVSKSLDSFQNRVIRVIPYLCRKTDPYAEIQIEPTPEGWIIKGRPRILFRGDFFINSNRNDASASVRESEGYSAPADNVHSKT